MVDVFSSPWKTSAVPFYIGTNDGWPDTLMISPLRTDGQALCSIYTCMEMICCGLSTALDEAVDFC
jgi:hypothetical protein